MTIMLACIKRHRRTELVQLPNIELSTLSASRRTQIVLQLLILMKQSLA